MHMQRIEFTLKRHYLAPAYTIGKLSLPDYIICDTLEDKVRDYNHDGDLLDAGEEKIFGETAIPFGRYRIIVTYSPKFKRRLPLLLEVMHFEAIRIHNGTNATHSHGCILVGENKIKGGLVNGKTYMDLLTKLIDKYIATNCEVFINII